jgi:hypothetical protein
MKAGRRCEGNGKWKMENGKWKMENGKWKMENGKWKMEKNIIRDKFFCVCVAGGKKRRYAS